MEPSETTVPVCYRHPDRATGLSCSRCGNPICAECSRDNAVGQLCPTCAAPSDRHQVISGRQVFGRPTFQTAPVSFSIIAITVAIFIGGMLSIDLDVWLTNTFAQANWLVAAGDWWRVFSAALLHASWLHLGFNMYALWIIGPLVEALYGHTRFLAIYLLCAAAGSATSYMFSDARFSVGASGAVFGLFGALLVADRVHKPALTRNARNITMQIGILIAINLFIGFSIPGIDNAAHIGGLIAGAWLGFIIIPNGATRLDSFWSRPGTAPSGPVSPDPTPSSGDRSRVLRFGGVASLVGVIALMIAIGPIQLL
jgi:membrane associated rhomboid family serine protease